MIGFVLNIKANNADNYSKVYFFELILKLTDKELVSYQVNIHV